MLESNKRTWNSQIGSNPFLCVLGLYVSSCRCLHLPTLQKWMCAFPSVRPCFCVTVGIWSYSPLYALISDYFTGTWLSLVTVSEVVFWKGKFIPSLAGYALKSKNTPIPGCIWKFQPCCKHKYFLDVLFSRVKFCAVQLYLSSLFSFKSSWLRWSPCPAPFPAPNS